MTTYTAIPNSDLDPESPVITSTMTLLRDNPIAIGEGDATAPALGASIVGQSQLNTALNSASTALGDVLRFNLAGGLYNFLGQLRTSNASRGAYSYGVESGSVYTTSTSFVTAMSISGNTISSPYSIAYWQNYYMQASPPYDMGDGQIGLFVYVAIHKMTGELGAVHSAEDAPWHYVVPTNTMAKKYIEGVPHREIKDMSHVPFTYEEAKKDSIRLREYCREFKRAGTCLEKITFDMQNEHMDKQSTPDFRILKGDGKDVTNEYETVLLDPVSELSHELLSLRKHAGFSLEELLNGGYFQIDNEHSGLKGPSGILIPKFKWKLTK